LVADPSIKAGDQNNVQGGLNRGYLEGIMNGVVKGHNRQVLH
jgi:hypothetical protein